MSNNETKQGEPKAYVVMECNDRSSYDGWWHPAATFTSLTAAQAFVDEAKRRLPELDLQIEDTPLDRAMPASDGSGHIWICAFSYDAGGNWGWDPYSGPIKLEGDDLADLITGPFDVYQLCAVYPEAGWHYPGEEVRVLATSADEAATKATPIIAAWIEKQLGVTATFVEGWSE